MSLTVAEDNSSSDIHLPADINWEMLDKSKFFFFGAALFSGVSCTQYPIIVLKTRQQVMPNATSSFKIAMAIFRSEGYRGFYSGRSEGYRGFYSGFGTSLMGTIPARAIYMSTLELTKSYVGDIACLRLGFSETSASVVANAAAGLSAAMAAQLIWTPIDVVSQRLMVQGPACAAGSKKYSYKGGIDAFRTIIYSDGIKGLYRGFGMSILTYAPSSAVWWASYSISHRLIWGCVGCNKDTNGNNQTDGKKAAVLVVQGLSAPLASGLSALVTMPLDTIKTRLQVLDGEESVRGSKSPTALQTVRNLFKEGGLSACYRGLGPRWASMSLSAMTMITAYEFLKQLSTKNRESFA